MFADCRVTCSPIIAHRRPHCVLGRHELVWVKGVGDWSAARGHHRCVTRTYFRFLYLPVFLTMRVCCRLLEVRSYVNSQGTVSVLLYAWGCGCGQGSGRWGRLRDCAQQPKRMQRQSGSC